MRKGRRELKVGGGKKMRAGSETVTLVLTDVQVYGRGRV